MSASSARDRSPRPAGLLVLALVLALEAIGTTVVGVLALVATPSGVRSSSGSTAADPTSGIAVAVFILLIAVLLAAVAVGLARARPWTRSAALVWQIVQALVGAYSLRGAGAATAFGAIAIGLAAVALVLLFTRPVREALDRA